jgi:hypothetical protein
MKNPPEKNLSKILWINPRGRAGGSFVSAIRIPDCSLKIKALKKPGSPSKRTPTRLPKSGKGSGRKTAQALDRGPLAAKRPLGDKRKSSRLLQNLKSLKRDELEQYFEKIRPQELLELFETSYASELVNFLLDLKKITCRKIFESAVRHGKKAYLDTIALYYYREYLTNPLPLEIESNRGESIPNYYAIIGVSKDAADFEIQDAAKLLIKAYQPENFPPQDRKMGMLRLNEIKEAFQQLRSDKRRHELEGLFPSIHYLYPRRDQTWMQMVQKLLP